jgi:hypothetical protein
MNIVRFRRCRHGAKCTRLSWRPLARPDRGSSPIRQSQTVALCWSAQPDEKEYHGGGTMRQHEAQGARGRSPPRAIPALRHCGWADPRNAGRSLRVTIADAGRCPDSPAPSTARGSGAPRGRQTSRGLLMREVIEGCLRRMGLKVANLRPLNERIAASCLAITLLLTATPAVADAARELARCEPKAERTYPAPDNRHIGNRQQELANRIKRAANVETCMRAAGYSITKACPSPAIQTFKDCKKRTNDLAERMAGRFNQEEYCRYKDRSVWAERRLSANCYQSQTWWRRWLSVNKRYSPKAVPQSAWLGARLTKRSRVAVAAGLDWSARMRNASMHSSSLSTLVSRLQ